MEMFVLRVFPCSKKVYELLWTRSLLGHINFLNDFPGFWANFWTFCCMSFSLLPCLLAGGGNNFGENTFAVFFFCFLQKRPTGPGGFESLTCWSSEDFSPCVLEALFLSYPRKQRMEVVEGGFLVQSLLHRPIYQNTTQYSLSGFGVSPSNRLCN